MTTTLIQNNSMSRLDKAIAANDAMLQKRRAAIPPGPHGDAGRMEAPHLSEFYPCTVCHRLLHQDKGRLFHDQKGRPIFTCSSCASERKRHEKRVSPLEKRVMHLLPAYGYHWVYQYELLNKKGMLKGFVDFVIPDLKVALECGVEWHRDPRRRARDKVKREMLKEEGYIVRCITAEDTVAQVDAAIEVAKSKERARLERKAEEFARTLRSEEKVERCKEAIRRANENGTRLHPLRVDLDESRKRLSMTSERMREFRARFTGNIKVPNRPEVAAAYNACRIQAFSELLDELEQSLCKPRPPKLGAEGLECEQ